MIESTEITTTTTSNLQRGKGHFHHQETLPSPETLPSLQVKSAARDGYPVSEFTFHHHHNEFDINSTTTSNLPEVGRRPVCVSWEVGEDYRNHRYHHHHNVKHAALIVGSDRLLQVFDVHWPSPESGDLWYTSRQLKKTH